MSATILEKQISLEDIFSEVSRMKSVVTEAVDEGMQSAMRAIRQGRDAAEDAVIDARRAVKRNPLQAMGVVFAAGFLVGGLAGWLASRR